MTPSHPPQTSGGTDALLRTVFGRAAESSLARLAPGYLFLPGLFAAVDSLRGVKATRLLISNLTHVQPLEHFARRAHRLEPLHEAAEARRYAPRPQVREVVAATVAGFRRNLELTEQTAANRLAGLALLELIDSKQFQIRVHVRGSFGMRAYLLNGLPKPEERF